MPVTGSESFPPPGRPPRRVGSNARSIGGGAAGAPPRVASSIAVAAMNP